MSRRIGLWSVGRWFGNALVALSAAFALMAAFADPEGMLSRFAFSWVYGVCLFAAAAVCALRAVERDEERWAWALIGSAVAAWAAGNAYWWIAIAEKVPEPFPSLADAFWLAFYPLAFVGIGSLVRSRIPRLAAAEWLDGLIALLAVGAIAVEFVFGAVVASTGGDTNAVAVNLAYPVGDLVLVAAVFGVWAATGWRPGQSWVLIGGALALFAASDSVYVYTIAAGTYEVGAATDIGWVLAVALVARAAWTQPVAHVRAEVDGWRTFAVPAAFAALAAAVLGWDHFARASHLGLVLAAGAVFVGMVRAAIFFGERLRALRLAREQALTDPLTGLGNRRCLVEDLERAFASANAGLATAGGGLAVFDLDGFKQYNDTFGHPAGDVLLSRLGQRLARAAARFGTAYRLGGDEFCVLAHAYDHDLPLLTRALAASLAEAGPGFSVTASAGFASLYSEARSASDALVIADRRLYADKATRPSRWRQTENALVAVLREQDSDLADHVDFVATASVAIARRLGLPEETIAVIRTAAELHDVGKAAIPQSILHKRGPLDEEEVAYLKRHTIIGERIVAAADALQHIAPIVRATHERWDGAGYPDALQKEEIPIAARVIAVADAYHAMTANRPYRPRIPHREALEQIKQAAGSQFDPAVSGVFADALREVVHGRASFARPQQRLRLAAAS